MAVFDVTLKASEVPADQTSFPVLVDLSDMPAAFWSTVTNGGGDIRVYKSDGTTEIAREVVSADTATDTGELWVLVPNLDSAVDTVIKVDVDGARTNYAVTDTYGRNAVWAAYDLVTHGGNTDSTGKNTLSVTGTSAQDNWLGMSGAAIGFGATDGAGSTDRIETGFGGNSTQTTRQSWFRYRAFSPNFGKWFDKDPGEPSCFFQEVTSTGEKELIFRHNFSSGATLDRIITSDDNVWRLHHITYDSGSLSNDANFYVDKSLQSLTRGEDPTALPAGSSSQQYIIGNSKAADRVFNGAMAEFRIRDEILSTSWIEAEYNNQNSPSTFYTITEAAGGGADVTGTVTRTTTRTLNATIAAGASVPATVTRTVTRAPDASIETFGAAVVEATVTRTATRATDAQVSAGASVQATVTRTATRAPNAEIDAGDAAIVDATVTRTATRAPNATVSAGAVVTALVTRTQTRATDAAIIAGLVEYQQRVTIPAQYEARVTIPANYERRVSA